jgi:uncharacterized protein YgfB (UPF0149 family)
MTQRSTPDTLLAFRRFAVAPTEARVDDFLRNTMLAPDYEELETALSAADLELSAAEAHGLITGAAAFPQPPALAELLFGRAGSALVAQAERLLETARALLEDVRHRLEDTDFGFEPLLGTDELPAQVERLAAWSRGYVLGLAAGGLRDPNQLRGDVGEFLFDVIRIGEAEMDDDEDSEREACDFAEIVEYMRVGVQLVYEELRGG